MAKTKVALARLYRSRLARECAKLDPDAERALAEEGMGAEGPAAQDIAPGCGIPGLTG